MPPSREFTFVLDPVVKEKLEQHLKVGDYRVKITQHRVERVYGTHQNGVRLIVLNLGHADFQGSSLTAVHTHIINTLLHEYRHAYQHAHWPADRISRDDRRSYASSEMEEDANEWASQNTAKWRSLGKLRSKTASRLGRLAAAERSLA
jgi:hypothetical protein